MIAGQKPGENSGIALQDCVATCVGTSLAADPARQVAGILNISPLSI